MKLSAKQEMELRQIRAELVEAQRDAPSTHSSIYTILLQYHDRLEEVFENE